MELKNTSECSFSQKQRLSKGKEKSITEDTFHWQVNAHCILGTWNKLAFSVFYELQMGLEKL